jgi:hypothetical protein
MFRSLSRHAILPALFAAALALPAAAEDAHHPPADSAKPPATQPAQPRAAQPGMPGPGGMMMGNMMQMMQMMHQMMSGMMQDHGAMHRMRMMGMGGMGMMGQMQGRMAGGAIEHAEGNIAFVRAELKITAAQGKAWDDYAAALRANAKQLNELAAELAKAPAAASPVDRIALQEKALAARLEVARRTKPALAALYAALSDEQKKAFNQLAAPGMGMGMGMGMR